MTLGKKHNMCRGITKQLKQVQNCVRYRLTKVSKSQHADTTNEETCYLIMFVLFFSTLIELHPSIRNENERNEMYHVKIQVSRIV